MSSHCIIILLIFNFHAFLIENVKAFNVTGRITFGLDGKIEQFPYLASLQAEGKHLCGASIISERHLLTAGHCKIYPTEKYSVRVGSNYWNKDGLYIESIGSLILHPKFNTMSKDYDYAVIFIRQPLTFSSTIKPVALPAKGEKVKSGETAVVAGWGSIDRTDSTTPSFKYATVSTLTAEDCVTREPEGHVITKRMLCAPDVANERDVCHGDSGNPLVLNGVLIGVASKGVDCKIYPGVYSLVSAAINFIEIVQKVSAPL